MFELIITHHNIRSITNKQTELKHYLNIHKPHVMTLNETVTKQKLNIPGYTYSTPKPNPGRGVGILYRTDMDVTELPPIPTKTETTNLQHSILIRTKDKYIQITTIYCPRKKPSPDIINETCKRHTNTIITGDFNCKHEDFGHPEADKDGNLLVQYMTENKMTKLNDNEPTYTNDVTGKQDVKDLMFASRKLTKTFTDITVDEDLGSDHNIIRATFTQYPTITKQNQTILLYHKADWTNINNIITNTMTQTTLNHTSTTQDIDNHIITLTKTIRKTIQDNVKRKQIDKNSTPLPQHIRQLITDKKQARKAWQKTHNRQYKTEYNRLNSQIQALIHREKQDYWDRTCDDLELTDNQDKTWIQLKQVLGLTRTKTKYPTLHKTYEDGTKTKATTTEQKTTLLTETLQDTFTHDNHPPQFNEYYRTGVNSYIEQEQDTLRPRQQIPQDYLTNQDSITLDKINRTIDKLKTKKAPGPDKITNKVIKYLKPSLAPIIHNIANICKQKGYHPTYWKTALAILLNKPDKAKTDPNNYRAISLINTLSKIIEQIITTELYDWTNDNNILPDSQSGFRHNRSTNDKLYITTQTISQAMNRKHFASSIFLDVEKAFDKVWLNGLIYKLIRLQYPTILIRYINSYLTDRYIYFKIKNCTSPSIKLNSGVPQGSALSPILFIIYTSDIPIPQPYLRIIRTQFADDLQDITEGRDLDILQNHQQTALNKLTEYNNNNRIKINAGKTKQIIYSHKKHIPKTKQLTINGDKVTQHKQARFLGITFDNRLTFTNHINTILNRARTRAIRLKNIYTTKHGPSPDTMIRLYKIFIRPLFEYGAPALVVADLKKWEQLQHNYIKHVLQTHYIPNKYARQLTQLPTIKDRTILLARNWYRKTKLNNTATTDYETKYLKDFKTMDRYWTPYKLITYNRQEYLHTLNDMYTRKHKNKNK